MKLQFTNWVKKVFFHSGSASINSQKVKVLIHRKKRYNSRKEMSINNKASANSQKQMFIKKKGAKFTETSVNLKRNTC